VEERRRQAKMEARKEARARTQEMILLISALYEERLKQRGQKAVAGHAPQSDALSFSLM